MNRAEFFPSHPRSFRFMLIVGVGFIFLYLLKRFGILAPPFPGFAFVAVGLLFLGATVPWSEKKAILLGALLALALLQFLLAMGVGEISHSPVWLFGLQFLLFASWTLWLFRYQPWSKDTFTLWVVSGILDLAIAPSLSFSQELLGFGTLVLITLWILVETDRLGDTPQS